MHLNQMQVQMQMRMNQMQMQVQMHPPRRNQVQVQMQMPHLHLHLQMQVHLSTSLVGTRLMIRYLIKLFVIYRIGIVIYFNGLMLNLFESLLILLSSDEH